MNFTFTFVPQNHLYWAGISSDERLYVTQYDLTAMSADQFQEMKILLAQLGETPGIEVDYDIALQRYCIWCPVPTITTMDNIRLEYS